jgi:hypothetical protein
MERSGSTGAGIARSGFWAALGSRWRLGHEGKFQQLESIDAGRTGVGTGHHHGGSIQFTIFFIQYGSSQHIDGAAFSWYDSC